MELKLPAVRRSQKLPDPFGTSPNVSGKADIDRCGIWQAGSVSSSSDGCFSLRQTGYRGVDTLQNSYAVGIDFNASNSNSIFGANSKVQPRSLQALIIIKA